MKLDEYTKSISFNLDKTHHFNYLFIALEKCKNLNKMKIICDLLNSQPETLGIN